MTRLDEDAFDEKFSQESPLTAAMADGRTPREVREHLDAAPNEKYDRLLEFVRVCAGDGWINTRGTARDVLAEIGETR